MNAGLQPSGEMVSEIPGITIDVPSPNKIVISWPDKQLVGQFAAEVREKRLRNRYKGQGHQIYHEVVAAKEGKTGGKSKKCGGVKIYGEQSQDSNKARLNCHTRVRGKVSAPPAPAPVRVSLPQSHLCPVIDDVKGSNHCCSRQQRKDFGMTGGNKEAAKKVGD